MEDNTDTNGVRENCVIERLANITTTLNTLGLIRYAGINEEHRYFCTPVNAIIFASEGMDGVHHCIIPAVGDLLLENSPMYTVNPSDPYDPIFITAANLYNFISLTIETGFAGAMEGIRWMTKEQFADYLKDNEKPMCEYLDATRLKEIAEERKKAIAALEEGFCGKLRKITDVYDYVTQLQAKTDISAIQLPPEYYELQNFSNDPTETTASEIFFISVFPN